MGRITIYCPKTGRTVRIGREISLREFEGLPNIAQKARCPACGKEHLWSRLSSEFDPDAAPEPPPARTPGGRLGLSRNKPSRWL